MDVLNPHTERLEIELVAVKAERGTERKRADAVTQEATDLAIEAAVAKTLKLIVEGLKTALETERQFRNEFRQDRDKVEAAMEKVRLEFAEWMARPWWRRLALTG